MAVAQFKDEHTLLIKAAKGDETAFSCLFYRHYQKILAFMIRLTRSAEVAEDIVQDVFLKVWEKREALTEVDRFDAYLYVLCRNHAFNTLKRFAYERAKMAEVESESMVEAFHDVSSMTDYYQLLDQAIEELPPQQQKVYLLSRRKRLKYKEIAQQMELSSETVKKYLKLATRSITGYLRTNLEK